MLALHHVARGDATRLKIDIHARECDGQIKVGRMIVVAGSQYRKRLLIGKALE